MAKFRGIALAGGLLLLAFLIYHIGPALLVEYLLRVGWWMLALLLIAAVRHSFRTVACRWAMGEEHRQLSFAAMYGVLLVSEAIKFVAFAGLVLGESAKALLLRKRVSAARAVSSVLLDVLLYNLSAALFSLGGIAFLFAAYPSSAALRRAGTFGALLVAAAVVLGMIAFARRWISAERLLGLLVRLRLIRTESRRFQEIDDQVFRFYHRHSRAFWGILAFDLAAHFTSAFEVLVAMALLGLPVGYGDAVAVEALTKLVRVGGTIVPANVGLFEGGTGLIFQALGLTLAAGIALGVVRQLRSILWAALGFAVLLFSKDSAGAERPA